MTAPELSETERARLDAIEAAEPAPESLRERVADDLLRFVYTFPGMTRRVVALEMVDAALAVIRGEAR